MKTAKLAKSYRIDDGKHFRLKDFDPADTGDWKSVDEANERVQQNVERMRKSQDKLYAQDCWSVLLIFQAMDAAGKDGTHPARHVWGEPRRRPGVLVQESARRLLVKKD
jgi:polyphosphate kinase 2 (PPK2 family)